MPELDKLVKLSQFFGVTLDELVTGEQASPHSEPPPAAVAASQPLPSRSPTQKIAGTVLLGLGALAWLLMTLAWGIGGLILGLIFAAPFFLCSVICLVCRRNVGLWCAWAVFFCVDGYLLYATGIGWSLVRWTLRYEPSWNYTRLAVAWVLLGFIIILVSATVIRLRKRPFQPDRKQMACLIAGWALFVVMNIPISFGGEIWILRGFWVAFFKVVEWVRLGLLTGLLTCTLRYIRTKRGKNNAES